MASDNLKQIGKFIGKTGRDADRALKRTVPIRPRLERIRDVFDSTTEFEMSFEKTPDDTRVLLDLFFNLPPPIRGCKVGCIITKCEDFDFTSGSHSVTVANPYLAGTVSVYIDGEKLDNSQVFEANPSGGEVYFQGPASYEAVSICYIYLNDDCQTDDTSLCLFDFEPSFAGAELVFCDRFDKAQSTKPFCGLGSWYSSFGSIETGAALPVLSAGGEATFNDSRFGQRYRFENLQGANVISETVWVVDFRGWSAGVGAAASSFSYNLLGSLFGAGMNVVISSNGHVITISRPFVTTPTASPGSSWGLSSQTQTFANPIPVNQMNQYMVCRFLVMSDVVWFKMWPLGSDEPDSWLQHTIPINLTGFPGSTAEYINVDFIGGSIGGSTPTANIKPGVLSIQHWIGRNQIFGSWTSERRESLPGYSWVRTMPMPQENRDFIASHPNVYFQADDYGFVPTLTQFQSGNSNLSGAAVPNHVYSYVTPFFGGPNIEAFPQINLFSGSAHYAVSFDTTIGKPTTYRVRGQVQWSQDSASRGIIPHLTVQLQAMNYGNQTPATDDSTIHGEVKQTIFMPRDPAFTTELPGASDSYSGWRSASAWYDFDIEIPCAGGNHVQWGAKFIETGLQIQEYLGYLAVDSILRSTAVHLNFRGVRQEALMNPITVTKNICDAGTLQGRCTQVIENFDVPYTRNRQCVPASSLNTTPDTYQSSSNLWYITSETNTAEVVIANNSVRVNFIARSASTDDNGSGRCPRAGGEQFGNDNPALNTARTSSVFSMFTIDSPANCGWFDYSAKFKFHLQGAWARRDGVSITPGITIIFASGTTNIPNNDFGSPVIPYVSVVRSQFAIPRDYLGYNNSISDSKPFPWTLDQQYNLYAQFRDQLFIKVWPVGTAEPSAWAIQAPREFTSVGQGVGVNVSIIDYSDDSSYVEFSDIAVISVDKII